jgi:hypothetical protein
MKTVAVDQAPSAVASIFPYDQWHDRYQEYYQTGLRQYLQLYGSDLQVLHRTHFPAFLKGLRRVRDASTIQRMLRSRAKTVGQYLDWLARHAGAQYTPAASLVGEYSFRLNPSRDVKVCIDTHDSGIVNSPSLLARCDVYLKANYWNGHEYHPKVRPFYVCNPVVLPHIDQLKAMRDHVPVFDVCFMVRVWGGPTGLEGVEHCLRLLEAVAKVRARKFLLAELVIGDTAAQARRLHRSGIPTTTRRIDLQQLWNVTARSRLNMSRLGNHHCMSWRMTDLLALGACTVLDQHPKTLWPAPLVPGQHYYSLNATTSNENPVAPNSSYAMIPELLEDLLHRRDLQADMRRLSGDYFDTHLHPMQIGRQIHDMAEESLTQVPKTDAGSVERAHDLVVS